ncbi:MAG: hypothetical protein JO015_17390 [Verrucomicrobia bacterium]|nr:hypothetical protein [Verrucomicrobiota bacterium]
MTREFRTVLDAMGRLPARDERIREIHLVTSRPDMSLQPLGSGLAPVSSSGIDKWSDRKHQRSLFMRL